MAKRYFEIDFTAYQYEALVEIAAEHGITPSDMLKCMWECRNSDEIIYHGEQINDLTQYLIEDKYSNALENIQDYIDNEKTISSCRENLGKLYYKKLKDIEDKDFDECVNDEMEELTTALKKRNEIWKAIGIDENDTFKQYKEEKATMEYAKRFLYNVRI